MASTIFTQSGTEVRALAKTLDLNGGAKILSLTVDPGAGSGTAAPIGSLAMNETSGAIFQKTGAANTAWVSVSSTGALPTSGGTMTGDITLTAGTGLKTAGGRVAGALIGIQQLTATTSSTYTPTSGTRLIYVKMCGGGGGSSGAATTGASQVAIGGSGQSGNSLYVLLDLQGNTSGTYQCGSGGAGGSAGANAGSAGSDTTLTIGSTTLTATGGAGSSGGTAGSTSTGGVLVDTTQSVPAISGPILYAAGFKTTSKGSVARFSTAPYFQGAYPAQSKLSSDEYIVIEPYITITSQVGGSGGPLLDTNGVQYLAMQNWTGATATQTLCPGLGGMPPGSTQSQSAKAGGAGTAGIILIYEYA